MQQSSTAADIVDKMFLGGRIQKNLPTVVEEECNVDRETASKRSSVESNTTVVQEVGISAPGKNYMLGWYKPSNFFPALLALAIEVVAFRFA